MIERRKIVLGSDTHRKFVGSLVASLDAGCMVTIEPPGRTLSQNDAFHAICDDIAKSDVEWFGKRRSAEEWKVLLVSAHSSATKHGCDMVQGLEGELVQLRESTARMSKERASSLLEYTVAWCASHGVTLKDGQ